MFCSNCGKEINNDVGVCDNCGNCISLVNSKEVSKEGFHLENVKNILKTKNGKIGIVIVVILLAVLILFGKSIMFFLAQL